MDNTSAKSYDINISKKIALTIYIFIQIALHLLVFRALNNHEYNIVEYISIFLALIYSFVVYLVILLNNKNKKTITYYCISTIFLSFFLIIDLNDLRRSQIYNNYVYFQIAVLFVMLDITLKILTQNISNGFFYKYIVVLWILGVILGISKSSIYMFIYQITFLIISAYPLFFLILHYKKIKNYGRHLIPTLLLLVFINIAYISWLVIINNADSGSYNYDFYVYLNIIEAFLSYLVLSALEFWKLIKKERYILDEKTIFVCIFIAGYLLFNRGNLIINIYFIISFILLLKQCQLLNFYKNLVDNKGKYIVKGTSKDNLFKNMIGNNILDYKREELYKEQVADFLHDEILQDVIYIKKELQDNYKISQNDNILNIADRVINKTRGQISLYKPYINDEVSLAENYYNLIQSLRNRFGNDSILIDFICDNKLFLSPPYDLVIYRMIHELVTNIFKHSKGDFSSIELKIVKKTIVLKVINYGDYLSDDNMNNTDSRGLKIIKREVDRFGGTLDIDSSINSETLEDIFDNSVVNIRIEIPIREI